MTEDNKWGQQPDKWSFGNILENPEKNICFNSIKKTTLANTHAGTHAHNFFLCKSDLQCGPTLSPKIRQTWIYTINVALIKFPISRQLIFRRIFLKFFFFIHVFQWKMMASRYNSHPQIIIWKNFNLPNQSILLHKLELFRQIGFCEKHFQIFFAIHIFGKNSNPFRGNMMKTSLNLHFLRVLPRKIELFKLIGFWDNDSIH